MKSMFVLSLSITLCMSTLVAADDSSDLTSADLSRNPVIVAMIENMDGASIYTTTDILQRIPTRAYGMAGNEEASSYLYGELSGIQGLDVEYTDGSFKNIVGILPGIDASSEEIFMVGAHYDSKSSDPADAPGATDNACGVGIVLEMARIMSQYQFNHTIAFAFWNNEEKDPASNTYAMSAAENSLKIPLYFNFDSSCYDPSNHFVLDIMYDDQSLWAKEMITRINTVYGINFTLTYNVHTCNSDHLSFRSHGYPAIMTHSNTHGPSHTRFDDINNVSSSYALKNGQLGMALIAQIAEVQDLSTTTENLD